MIASLDQHWWVWPCASLLLSTFVTTLSIRYAHRSKLLDMPGQRRSHSTPTPRGGGIGIVVAVIFGCAALAHFVPGATSPLRLMCAIVLIALVGWIDDHRPLPALLRLLVHCVAVAIWLSPLIAALFAPSPVQQPDTMPWQSAGILATLGFICVWSINLHNFMDGIDGLLSMQAIFVLCVLAVLCLREPGSMHPLQIGLWAAAIAGFVPFNFPRARVFMGDVGSGAVGMLIAVAAIWQSSTPETAVASGVIAVSAFVTDASCTLVSRMFYGRRWYSAHREHLYQWMTRTGMSHARVVAWYLGWNLLIVLPLLCLINRRAAGQMPGTGISVAVAVYTAAVALWIFGKRWCLHKVELQRHAVA